MTTPTPTPTPPSAHEEKILEAANHLGSCWLVLCSYRGCAFVGARAEEAQCRAEYDRRRDALLALVRENPCPS